MPVAGKEVLDAKLKLHVALNVCPAVITVIVLGWCVAIDWQTIVFMAVFVWMFVWIIGEIGLILGLKRPNFNWTTETMPIKQSMNVMLSMLADWALTVLVCGGGYLLRSTVSVGTYVAFAAVAVALAARMLKRWLDTKGDALFSAL